MIRVSNLNLSTDYTKEQLLKKISKSLNVPPHVILDYTIFRRSLDARKKHDIHYVFTVDVIVKVDEKNPELSIEKILKKAKNSVKTPDTSYKLPEGNINIQNPPVVIGSGPCGLFAGLILAQLNLKPIILERGEDVDSRKKTVDDFWKNGNLNTESNVQFGEGGAGTFSDGKLTTRIKDPRFRKILEEFVELGADEDILIDTKAHIGTDLLQGVVKKLREKIISLGGDIRFSTKVNEIIIENNITKGVKLESGEIINSDDVILAVGHSARDTFEMLHEKGVQIEQKPFAVGLRIEHLQEDINSQQYGESYKELNLPPADYALTHTTSKGRGVYTFCMCPGGYVVGASSEENRLAINGMSYNSRDGKHSNSALLVQVYPSDFPSSDPLSGIEFQRSIEEKAFILGGSNYTAPSQSLGEFLNNKPQENQLKSTYEPAVKNSNLKEIFPDFINEALVESIPFLSKRLKGFNSNTAVLTGVESRSSSPIRIKRNSSYESENTQGLYPAGEGAGYSGGIISSAVDGINVAEKIFEKYLKNI